MTADRKPRRKNMERKNANGENQCNRNQGGEKQAIWSQNFCAKIDHITKERSTGNESCSYCQCAHPFAQFNRLLAMSLKERVNVAVKLLSVSVCFHCASNEHGAKNCPEKKNDVCALCIRKGHIAIFHGLPALFKENG